MLNLNAQTMLNIAQIVLKTAGVFAQHSTQSTQQYYSNIYSHFC